MPSEIRYSRDPQRLARHQSLSPCLRWSALERPLVCRADALMPGWGSRQRLLLAEFGLPGWRQWPSTVWFSLTIPAIVSLWRVCVQPHGSRFPGDTANYGRPCALCNGPSTCNAKQPVRAPRTYMHNMHLHRTCVIAHFFQNRAITSRGLH